MKLSKFERLGLFICIALILLVCLTTDVSANGSAKEEKQWVFIGDSFIKACDLLGCFDGQLVYAKVSTAPRDWFDEKSSLYVNYLSEIKKLDPDKIAGVVYLYGINDISCDYNLKYSKKLIKELHKQFPESSIYVNAVFPVALARKNSKSMNANVESFNEDIWDYCNSFDDGVYYLDLRSDFLTSKGYLKKDFTKDNIHLTKQGYLDWLELVNEIVKYKSN